MKKIIIGLIAIIFPTFLAGQVIPEKYDTPEKRSEIATQRMIQKLPLSQKEVPAIRQLNLKYARMVQKEVIDPELNWFSAYFKIKEINSLRDEELRPLLNDSQWQNYQKLKAETRKEMLEVF